MRDQHRAQLVATEGGGGLGHPPGPGPILQNYIFRSWRFSYSFKNCLSGNYEVTEMDDTQCWTLDFIV